jgi:excisionase family DNA binding protein
MAPEDDEMMTTDQAAKYLGVKPGTLRMWVRRGYLVALRLPGGHRSHYRFRKSELDRAIRGRVA